MQLKCLIIKKMSQGFKKKCENTLNFLNAKHNSL